MGKIAMVLRRAPYGDINAAEAVRHAMGGVADELTVDLILVDSGVLLAKKGQDDTGTGFTNLEGTLKDCIDMGVEVYADKASAREQHLESADIVDGVKLASAAEIAELMQEAKTTMIF
ncbi:MAG: DsrE family protein [Nitrospirae bacterium]|nr:DsrE family protein [Nitrospirota bacterium]MCL5421232.1 DsrE family protein [Nitrospirota bacterium]